MRLLTADGYVGITPEPKRGKNGDYVKFRLGTKEHSDDETVWYNVIVKGHLAKIVLERVKKGESVVVSGTLLKGRNVNEDDTIMMTEFSWSKAKRTQPEPQSDDLNDFDFESYDEIPFA